MRKTILIAAVALMFAGGCALWPEDPRADLVATAKVFAATERTLATAIRAGKFNAEQVDEIAELAGQVRGLLAEWETAVLVGTQPAPDRKAMLERALQRLLGYQMEIDDGH